MEPRIPGGSLHSWGFSPFLMVDRLDHRMVIDPKRSREPCSLHLVRFGPRRRVARHPSPTVVRIHWLCCRLELEQVEHDVLLVFPLSPCLPFQGFPNPGLIFPRPPTGA